MGQTKRLAKPISLTIEYEDAEGEITTRPIQIEAIGTGKNGVFFEAECGLRNQTRTFLIHQITAVIDDDGVVHDPAPIIGQVLLQAQAGARSQAGRTRRQRAMDEANARLASDNSAANDSQVRVIQAPHPGTRKAGAFNVLLGIAAAMSPFFYVESQGTATIMSLAIGAACAGLITWDRSRRRR